MVLVEVRLWERAVTAVDGVFEDEL